MIFVTLKFYTYSVPTERLSCWSLFLKTFRYYGTYLFGKIFYTYSVPTERISRWSLFLQTFRSYGTLFYFGKFSTHIAFLRNASYKSNRPSSSFQHQTSNLKIFSLPHFLQFFADFSFRGIFARNIELSSRNFIGQEFLIYKISFVRMGILVFFAII